MGKTNLELLKDLSDRLVETEEELSAFFHLSPCLFCIAHTSGYFIKVNPLMNKILGYQGNELISSPWLSFVHPDDIKSTVEIAQQMTLKKIIGFTNRYRHSDGHYVTLRWLVSRFQSDRAYCVAEKIEG